MEITIQEALIQGVGAHKNGRFELKSDDGKLFVSLGEDKDTKNSKLNHKKIVDVVTGSLVLFPGSLTHYTIPFKSNKERIVLAFDVKPK